MVQVLTGIINDLIFPGAVRIEIAADELLMIRIGHDMIHELESQSDVILQTQKRDGLHMCLVHRVLGNRITAAVRRAGAVDRAVQIHR